MFDYNYVRLLEIMNNFKLIFFVKVEKTDSNIYNNNLLLHYLSCSIIILTIKKKTHLFIQQRECQ